MIAVTVLVWADQWYRCSAETSGKFTPGDMGSAFGIANYVTTIVLAYFAWKAYETAKGQLYALKGDQKFQLLERTLAAAIGDYTKRLQANSSKYNGNPYRSSFHYVYNLSLTYAENEAADAVDQRYSEFRTANYLLKPLTSWCRWVAENVKGDVHIQISEYELLASRIIGVLDSECQVYLLMCDALRLESIEVEHKGYLRRIRSHVPVMQFLSAHAKYELEEVRFANQGVLKRVFDMANRVGWHENASVRNRFFGSKQM